MKRSISEEIAGFVSRYQQIHLTETCWRAPLVGYASASDPDFHKLRTVVGPTHAMPIDLLEEAKTVVAYFLPFDEETVKSNVKGETSSRKWVQAYLETNKLIQDLGLHMKSHLEGLGHAAINTPVTHNFDPEELISDWSHRHVAFIAGLGRFGLNNMLITKKGCCGRLGSLITSAYMEPDTRKKVETCLYHYNGKCMKCTERCVNEALFEKRFDRHKCYEMCLCNEEIFRPAGRADVCGKCLVDVPCSIMNPVSKISRSGK